MVDDLLDVSRITQGNIQVHKADFDLRQAVERAAEQARSRLDGRRQRLKLTLPTEPVLVYGDAVRLAQVVVNLLTNASKFSPPASEIQVSLAVAGVEARVWVRDQGVGIPGELLPHIFEPFVQAPQSRDRNPGGLGLGLALAGGLAKIHGGRLEAVSAGPGEGSLFTLRLPLALAPAPDTADRPPPSAANAAPPQSGLSILVVDDNRDVAESTAMLLELAGHHPHVVHDGDEALAEVEALRPDVVLLDIGLPRMDGFEVVRRLRRTSAGRSATVLAVSGYDLGNGRGGRNLDLFDGHLLKPVGLKALLDTIETHHRPG